MSYTREKLKEKLKEVINVSKNNFTDEEIELILDYHLLERGEKLSNEKSEKLKKLYQERISSFDNFIYKNDIINLVSCISLAPNNVDTIEEIPILKTLRIFNNVKNIYLLHTKESEIRINKELREYLESKNIKIIKHEIDSDNLVNINHLLKKLTTDLSKENTIFDLTLGMKMAGVALYKSAVETGIKAINWIDFQFPSYKKIGENNYEENITPKRIPLMTKITLMKEPLRENQKIYNQIDMAFKKYDFNIISKSYDSLGQEDKEFFFKELSKIINQSLILSLDPDKFYDNVKILLDKIFKYNFEQNTKLKIKDFVIKLAMLSEVSDDKIIEFGINKNDLEDYKDDFLDNDVNIKDMVFYLLVSNIIDATLGINNIDDIIKGSILEKIFIEDFSFNFKKTFAENIFKYYYGEYPDDNYEIEYEDYKNIFNLRSSFMEDRKIFVYLENNILTIEKLDLEIDLLKIDISKYKNITKSDKIDISKYIGKKGKFFKYLYPVLSLLDKEKDNSIIYNGETELDVESFLLLYNKDKEKRESTFEKDRSNIVGFTETINTIIKKELEIRGKVCDENLLLFYPENLPELDAKKFDSTALKINNYFLEI